MAVPYQFVVFDPTLGQGFDDDSYSFLFDSSPSVDIATPISFSLLGSVQYTIAGVKSSSDGPFTFLTGDAGFSTPLSFYFSEQLFTGSTSAPTFRLGTFTLDVGTITISAVGGSTSPVPEPAGWAMMIAGFGMMGAALRTRRLQVHVAI